LNSKQRLAAEDAPHGAQSGWVSTSGEEPKARFCYRKSQIV
jgi:hypothetical protein